MRILLVRLGMLGDVLGACSVMPILKAHFGDDVTFDWIVRPAFKSLFDFDPSVKNVYAIKSKNIFYQFFFFLQHHFAAYDLILNLEVNHELYLLKWISASKKLGFPFQKMVIPERMHLYSLHQYIVQQALGLSSCDFNTLPVLFGVSSEKIKDKFGLKKPYLIIAPATSKTGKKQDFKAHRNWPVSAWNDFIMQAKKQLPFELVIVGTKSDNESIGHELIVGDAVVNCMGQTTLPELITLIRDAVAVVTCDTGILHLTSAIKTPIFALLGPTDAYRHGPFPVHASLHTVIRSGVGCSPCELTPVHKKCRSNICMQQITAERVCDDIKNKLMSIGNGDVEK